LGRRIYVVGGFTAGGAITSAVEAFDVDRDAWVTLAPLPQPLHHVNLASAGGRLYVIGALARDDFGAVGSAWSYDPSSNQWTPRASMPPGTERGASGVAAIGSKIYVAGGIRGVSVGDFSSYDIDRDVWTPLPPMSGPRDHLGAAAIGGAVYAVGGRQDGALRGRVDRFDPASQTWVGAAPMLTPRGGLAVAAAADRIFAIGGEGNRASPSGVFPENEEYDPAIDRWISREPMPTPRHGTGAAVVDGRVFVPGGATVQNFAATAVSESYTP
jgi:N-acetylneuraminic acid mutarotase